MPGRLLQVTVSNLTPGKKYVLYEYQQTTVTGTGGHTEAVCGWFERSQGM